ncbi:UDP-N-acetylmuramoyl-tripeptide--D-alanyl-D-alanine ligase [candidate division KSB1 bacterium]|nr:UDP-N-acetylmuramoyl-tripeptide--D-alanyl-D-alanine ligase [candidate division KSB1 bacterium]
MRLPTIGWFCAAVGASCPSGMADAPLGPVCYDSRKLQAGDTFIAVVGEHDGHDYVERAFAAGAKSAIVCAQWASRNPAQAHRQIVVDDTLSSLQLAGKAWRRQFSVPVVGITGSNGKTSTKDILLKLLAVRYDVGGTEGNLNNQLGVPLTLLSMSGEKQVLVVEMGASRTGEIGELCAISQPTHGLVTSIARAHMAGFGTLTAVARTKGQLYDAVAEAGVAFVHTGDELCRIESSRCRQVIGYGFGEPGEGWSGEYFRAQERSTNELGGMRFTLRDVSYELNIPGQPAALAALAGLAIAGSLGVPLEACRDTVRNWVGVPGRMRVEQLGRLRVLDDSYNANPASMRAALTTLATFSGNKMAILGTMAELGEFSEEEHRRLTNDLSSFGIPRVIFVGSGWSGAAARLAERGINAMETASVSEMAASLPRLVDGIDVLLLKGSRSVQLDQLMPQLRKLFA